MNWRDNLNYYNLTVARENIGLSTLEATKLISKSKVDKVALWEAGQVTDKSPTYKQIGLLADKYNISEALFFIEDKLDVQQDLPAYRSSQVEESYYLRRFISLLRIRQNLLRSNMILDQASINPLVGSGKSYTDAMALAEFIREKIGYYVDDLKNNQALSHLKSLLEKQYIFVFKNTILRNEKIPIEEMRGIYINDQYAPVIALNREDSLTGQLFTLAHELVHLFRGEDKLDSIDFRMLDQLAKVDEEVFCNQVASQLLMPQEKIPRHTYVNPEEIQGLAKKFQVSNLACFYRLKDMNRIQVSKLNHLNDFFRIEMAENLKKKQLAKSKKKTNEKFSPYISIKAGNGNLFSEYVFSLHLDNRLSASEAQRLLRLPLGRF